MKKMIGFAAGDDDDVLRGHGDSARPGHVFGDGAPQRQETGGGRVMRVAFVERALGGLPDVGGGVEIGLADFHVDDS